MSTAAQRTAALAKANDIRMRAVTLRRRLHDMPEVEARRELVKLLLSDDLDESLGALPIDRLLSSITRFGDARIRQVLRYAAIATTTRRVRDLTMRQRGVIADVLANPRILWSTTKLPPLR